MYGTSSKLDSDVKLASCGLPEASEAALSAADVGWLLTLAADGRGGWRAACSACGPRGRLLLLTLLLEVLLVEQQQLLLLLPQLMLLLCSLQQVLLRPQPLGQLLPAECDCTGSAATHALRWLRTTPCGAQGTRPLDTSV